jgi:excinuclease UvrABC nuclease subunit
MGDYYSMEPSFSVWIDDKGVKITISVSPDAPGIVRISAPDDDDQKYFGPLNINITKEYADLLAEAIKRQVQLMDDLDV